jgi:hypothetical protein
LLSDWVAKLAPAAAAFVGSEKPRSTAPLASEPQTPDAPASAAAQARFTLAPAKNVRKVLASYAALTVLFLGMWQFFSVRQRPPYPGADGAPSAASLPSFFLVLTAVFLGIAARLVQRRRGKDAQLRAALVALARGKETAALASLQALTSAPPLISAQALLTLATEAERTGDLRAAEALCEQGIAKGATSPIAASTFLLPGLFAEHALTLAARGESAQALAELALLEQRHPAYALLDTARFRVTLLDKARRGDFAGAARIAEKSADLPLTVRDELLADLVRVLADPESNASAETERLRKELRGDTVSAAWIEKVAPRVIAAFAGGGTAALVEEIAAHEEAEREALAAEEEEKERARGWV